MTEPSPVAPTGPACCDECGTPESDLTSPLKRCAKCGTKRYCSRACQTADWTTNHKKQCARLAADAASGTPVPGSLTNPPVSDLSQGATGTVDLMAALTHMPGFSALAPEATDPPVLRHLFSFCMTTYNDYWGPLLTPLLSIQLAARLPIGIGSGTAEEKQERIAAILEKFEEMESKGGFDRNQWPEFDKEKYTDALGRNTLACLIVRDPEKRKTMFSGMEPEGWGFGEEVEAVARRLMSGEGDEALRRAARGTQE